MPEFRAVSRSPARVHEQARALTGHHPCWLRRPYSGGIYCTEHFRVCSYCGSVHPSDMIELLEAGRSTFESTTKLGKYVFTTPNPVAGELVRMGSLPVAVFNWVIPPQSLRKRLNEEASERDATTAERLIGHIERPILEEAPAMIRWPFYSEHTTDRQWPEIWAAAAQGAGHAQIQGTRAHDRHHDVRGRAPGG